LLFNEIKALLFFQNILKLNQSSLKQKLIHLFNVFILSFISMKNNQNDKVGYRFEQAKN
jgi:hypothetical protein